MHTLAEASNYGYATSWSGYVITVLVAMILILVGYNVRVNDRRHKENTTKLERVEMNYNALNKTVAVLDNTVNTLKEIVDKLFPFH